MVRARVQSKAPCVAGCEGVRLEASALAAQDALSWRVSDFTYLATNS